MPFEFSAPLRLCVRNFLVAARAALSGFAPSWLHLIVLAPLTGCTLHPPGERQERDNAAQVGKPYAEHIDQRNITPLPSNPTLDQVTDFALLNNAELEQRYWEWIAAIEQVPQDGTQSASLNIGSSTTITRGKSSWSASSLTLGNDPMSDIKWPGKLDAAAKASLENAKAAGMRFAKAKFELRSKLIGAYDDYALTNELALLEQSNGRLLDLTASTVAARNRAGGTDELDLLKARNESDMSRNDLARLQSQLPGQLAAINALLGRSADAELSIPSNRGSGGDLKYTDCELLDQAAKNNPELVALADETAGKKQAIRLAKLQYVPDFNLSVSTDLAGVAQQLVGQASIPLFRFEAINAGISQAEANLRANEALRHQTARDIATQVITDLAMLHNSDRQLLLLEKTVLPRQQRIVDLDRSAYEAGRSTLLDLLESRRSLIAIQRLVARLHNARDKQLADLEAVTTLRLTTTAASGPS
jgi:outer membrane protein TolC